MGLSLGKILFTVLLVIAIWKAFALAGRLARERQEALARRAHKPPARHTGAHTHAVELVRCRRCGAYFDPSEGCRCERNAA